MKSRFTHPLTQVVLTSIALIAISIACSASKSAESPSANAANASTNQSLTLPRSSQDKQPCTLTLSAAPGINGLRLGMTPDEVLALFAGSKDDPDLRADLSRPPNAYGGSSLVMRPSKYDTKERYAGISQITFTFLDGRLSNINTGYAGPEYSHVDKFVEVVARNSNLPPVEQWEPYVGLDNQMKILKCAEFEVRVFAGGPGGNLNYVLMQDLEADKKLKERRAKARATATP